MGSALFFISVQLLEDYLVTARQWIDADALVLMAGSMPERLPAVEALYKQGKGRKILITNDGVLGAWSIKFGRNLYQAEWAQVHLEERHIPKESIEILPFSSSGTFYDALSTRKYVCGHHMKSLVIVTSDYHTRRSLWTFRNVFRGLPVSIGVFPVKTEIINSSSIGKTKVLLLEGLKLFYYRIRFNSFETDSNSNKKGAAPATATKQLSFAE